MTDQNVAVITFTESSKAYEALSDLRQASVEGRIDVVSALIAEREKDGHLYLAEGSDTTIGAGTAAGGLIGMVVGLIGGPLGVLLGWGAGSVIGSLGDIDHADKRGTVLGDLGRASRCSQGALQALTTTLRDGLRVPEGRRRPMGEPIQPHLPPPHQPRRPLARPSPSPRRSGAADHSPWRERPNSRITALREGILTHDRSF